MKKTFSSFAIILIGLSFTASHCKKPKMQTDNPYGLPNATQTGANIFACRVNGQNWISKQTSFDLGGSIINDTLAVKGTYHGIAVETIYLLIKGDLQQGNMYNVNINCSINYTTTRLCNSNNINFYSYQSSDGEAVLTKLDRVNKIISGTFFFNIIRQNCTDTLHFTDGRFDIRY